MEVAVAGVPERPDPDVVLGGDRARSRGACPGPASAARRRPPSSRRRASRAPSGRPGAPGAAGRPRRRRASGRWSWRRPPVQAASPAGQLVVRRRRRAGPTRSSASRRRRGRGPAPCTSSTARIVNWSISSRVTGESPAAAIAATPSPADSSVGKNASSVARGGGRRAKPERGLGDQRERALRPDDQVGQRVAGDVLDVLAAGPDDGCRRPSRPRATSTDVARLAVLDAAQAAGVRARGCRRSSTSRSSPDRARRTARARRPRP